MWFCLSATVALLAMESESVTISARLNADKLEVGHEYALLVNVAVAEGYTTTRTGGPPPIVQLKVPPSVELFGAVLRTPAERSHRGFMYEPFARVIGPGESTIRFTLKSPPADGEAFGVNVVGYVAPRDSEDVTFFRQRIRVPLKPGAAGEADAPTLSEWGDEAVLKLGDQAPPFKLPRYLEPDIALADFSGKPVVITTYRLFLSVPCQKHLTALHEMYGEFQKRGVTVIALAQEDIDFDTHINIRKGLPEKLPYILTVDLPSTAQTAAYERITTYLIDKEGVVRQILPGTTEQRAPWRAVLNEIDRLGIAQPVEK